MIITIDKAQILRTLYTGIFLLLVAHISVHAIAAVTGHDYLFGLTTLVNFYEEANLPTLYSTMLLLASSTLLLAIYKISKPPINRFYWFVLAAIFMFLAIDEFAQIHELIGSFISRTDAQNLLPNESSSAWIFWGAAFSLTVAIAYFRFWWNLQRRVRTLFLVAGLVYVGGALGFEVLEVFYLPHAKGNFGFLVLVTIEELMEMVGIVIFISGLLEQLRNSEAILQLHLD